MSGAGTHPRYMQLNQKSSMREERMSHPWMTCTERRLTQRPLAAGGPTTQVRQTGEPPGGALCAFVCCSPLETQQEVNGPLSMVL